ncbi:MAG: TIR domain-containing protein [Pseudomonadota bacterium]
MGERRFKAFISYSHADEAWGGWLQRSLENFRAPKSLASKLGAKDESARLAPVFRDREDLPVAGSLNSAIQAALADSEFQIVLCSPNSAKSRWVNEEIKLFHKLHGPGRVFALIVAGEPGASAIAGREAEECFPPALRFQLGENGELTDAPAEPLAADARENGDGKRYALLKVAAGMLGVGLDDLIRRDAQRRARLATVWTVSSGCVAAAMTALALYAVAKNNEATLMRGKAEGVIQFMLIDLKKGLNEVGRLDLLESVGEIVMAYYADQDPKSLDDDALAHRAKALILLGAIDQKRNDLEAAIAAYAAGEKATAELLRRSPNNPDRIFDHAQSVFYVGDIHRLNRNFAEGEKWYEEYHRLAQRLVIIDSDDPKWRLELAYATSNLGVLKYDAGDFEAAIPYFKESTEARRVLAELSPTDEDVLFAYAYAISWRADAELKLGRYGEAVNLIRKQLSLYGTAASPQSENFSVLDAVVTAQRRLAEAYVGLGDLDKAREAIDAAAGTASRLAGRDGGNANWNVNAAYIELQRSSLFSLSGDRDAAIDAADRAVDHATAVTMAETGAQLYLPALGLSFALRISLNAHPDSVAEDAREVGRLLAEARKRDILVNSNFIGSGSLALADFERRQGRDERAAAIIADGVRSLEAARDRLPVSARIYLAGLYLEAGASEKAAPILDELEATGVRHSDYLELRKKFQRLAAN